MGGEDVDVVEAVVFGEGGIETHLNVHVEVPVGLKLVIAHVEGRDRRVVRYLLDKDRDASDLALEGLPDDGIEGLAESRMAGEDKHEGCRHVLDLLYWIVGLDGLVHVLGDEAKATGHSFKEGLSAKDLDGQTHGHDGLACQDVRGNLLDH